MAESNNNEELLYLYCNIAKTAALVNSQCNEYKFLQSVTSFCYNHTGEKSGRFRSQRCKKIRTFSHFFITWEVGRWEWIFYFIDIRLKLINFELKKDNKYKL